MKTLFSQAALGWLGRRVLDWGGWLGTMLLAAIGFYNALPPSQQVIVSQVLTGDWQSITLGAVVPFIVLVVSQVMSFRATVKPQVVTSTGAKISAEDLPSNKRVYVEEAATIAAAEKKRRPTIFDKLFGQSR